MMVAVAALLRLKLSLLNGIAAISGCLLFPGIIEWQIIAAAFLGVMLLAAGSSALNQLIERDLDSRMNRTQMRPLPQSVLSLQQVAVIGVSALLAGLLTLYASGGMLPALLGTAATLWYLAVYTPLKRRTSLALPIGALCGAFPPLLGWCLAGGDPVDFRIMFLCGLLFLWQVPHFWLLQRRHRNDYLQAGIPLFLARRNETADPFFRLWMAALCAGAMLLPAFGIIARPLALCYTIFPLALLSFILLSPSRLHCRYLNMFPLMLSLFFLIQKSF
ncbi:MAG TPA: protoheme IX farnesyltransferase [Desulfuromonadales bacterium]|nr:protoheme IX farnesyltransferase [Desulfuromonadales bacterium]